MERSELSRAMRNGVGLLCCAVWLSTSVATEPEILRQDSGGTLALDPGARKLRLDAEGCEYLIRVGRDEELRYQTRTEEGQRELEVVWSRRGGEIRVAPVLGAEEELACFVECTVPAELALDVEIFDQFVEVQGLRGGVVVEGRGNLQVKRIHGTLQVALEESAVLVQDSEAEIELSGSLLEFDVKRNAGSLRLDVDESTGNVREQGGPIEATLSDTVLQIEGAGRAEIDARGGQLRVQGLQQGGEILLRRTPLELHRSKGDLTVQTDDSVDCRSHEGAVKIIGAGSEVLAMEVKGRVVVKNDGASVDLRQIQGEAIVTGEDLEVEIHGASEGAVVDVVSSTVLAKTINKELTIRNEFGDIRVEDAEKTEIESRDGDLFLYGLRGTANVQADGRTVEIGWVSAPKEGDLQVANPNGDVLVTLPAGTVLSLDLETSAGEITGDVEGLNLSPDSRKASGSIGSAEQPILVVRAGGTIDLTLGAN